MATGTKTVTAILNQPVDSNGKTAAPKKDSFWIRAARFAGYMSDQNEPKWNGTAIVCSILATVMVIVVVIQSGINWFDKKDAARFQEAKLNKVAADTDKLLNASEERHAKTLEFIKVRNKELYDAIPEEYKRFDSRAFNQSVLEQSNVEQKEK